MDLRDVQAALNARGRKPPLDLDGQAGPATLAAIEAFLAAEGVTRAGAFSRARQVLAAKQVICRLAGIEVGEIDGLDGPQTRHALDVWDGRQRGNGDAETWRDNADALPPAGDNLPDAVHNMWPRQSEVERYYGQVGKNQTMLECPWLLRIAWETEKTVRRFSIHERVHDSAARVLDRVLDHYGEAGIRALGLDLWGGSLNVRRMRGGSAWSMHSWGIAIDWDPDHNQLRWGRDRARLARPDAEMWWRLWEDEGWLSLGRARNYDWMHVQAARL